MIDHRFNWTVLPSLNDVIEKRTIVFAQRFDLRIIDELIQLEIRNLELVNPIDLKRADYVPNLKICRVGPR